jgi:4-amino-4-deoxy-L-arabinose transferase-like glycosyltransferase
MSIDVEVIGRWETHIATLLFIIALLHWLRHFRQRRLSWKQGAISGFLWGLLLLTSPSFVTVLFGLVAATVMQKHLQTLPTLSYLVTFGVVTAVVLMPWTIRNYRTFGTFVFVRDNAGLEFYLSNLPDAKRSMNDNLLAGAGKFHPYGSASSRHRIQEIGEVAFSRECMQKFIDNVTAQPATFARRLGQRILWMWFPVGEHSIRDSMLPRDLIASVITLLGFLGLYFLPVEIDARKVFAIALFSYPLVYYLIQTTMRYRLPIVWITCLLCANAVLVLAQKFVVQELPEPYRSTTLSNMS